MGTFVREGGGGGVLMGAFVGKVARIAVQADSVEAA